MLLGRGIGAEGFNPSGRKWLNLGNTLPRSCEKPDSIRSTLQVSWSGVDLHAVPRSWVRGSPLSGQLLSCGCCWSRG